MSDQELHDDQHPEVKDQTRYLTRRQFLKSASVSAAYPIVTGPITRLLVPEYEASGNSEREEKFAPFNKGLIEWQYVAFSNNQDGKDKTVFVSLSTRLDPRTGGEIHQLLVKKDNVSDGVVEGVQVYEGRREYDEYTSTYRFFGTPEGVAEEKLLAEFCYDKDQNKYKLRVDTKELDTETIAPGGLYINSWGNLINVSNDGEFDIYTDKRLNASTIYYADYAHAEDVNGNFIGYARRDSEMVDVKFNLLAGESSSEEESSNEQTNLQLDIDHYWINVQGKLEDGRRFGVNVWQSKSETSETTDVDFDYKYITLYLEKSVGSGEFEELQYNEDDLAFALSISVGPDDVQEVIKDGKRVKMAHSADIVARYNDQVLFEGRIEGFEGQMLEEGQELGIGKMVETGARIVAGQVMGSSIDVQQLHLVVIESTDEAFLYRTNLPFVISG